MKAFFEKLYNYNQWANLGLCEHLQQIEEVPDEVMLRMSHIVAAEEIWFDRIEPLGFEPLPVFKTQPWEILEPRLKQSAKRWLQLIAKSEDFEARLDYSNLAGKPYSSQLSDVLLHLANHGTYHRGQIATLLRQQGLEPLPTDYMLFSRERRA